MNERLLATTYEFYADYVAEQGGWVSRKDAAQAFDVHISTATYNLEKAVQSGALIKLPGFVGRQPGWIYGLPDWQPRLIADESMPSDNYGE